MGNRQKRKGFKDFKQSYQPKKRGNKVIYKRKFKQIKLKTEKQKQDIAVQFPVSSGQQHRMTEAKGCLGLPAVPQSAALPKNYLGKPATLVGLQVLPNPATLGFIRERELSCKASSKHMLGQFTGSTGANVLKPKELHSGPQLWTRRNQLTSAKPVTDGKGMYLLQKMGWRPGEGLGREKNGCLQPILIDVKLGKRGLVARQDSHLKEAPTKRRVAQSSGLVQQNLKEKHSIKQSAVQNLDLVKQNLEKKQSTKLSSQSSDLIQKFLEKKHPVSLLNELISKRKWNPPLYTVVNENGPSHSKMFLISVQVNGQTFTPNKACSTKKEAKTVAAKHCLQQIGAL